MEFMIYVLSFVSYSFVSRNLAPPPPPLDSFLIGHRAQHLPFCKRRPRLVGPYWALVNSARLYTPNSNS